MDLENANLRFLALQLERLLLAAVESADAASRDRGTTAATHAASSVQPRSNAAVDALVRDNTTARIVLGTELLTNETAPIPPVIQLANRIGLSPFQTEVLLLAVGVELCPQLRELTTQFTGRPTVTIATALRLLGRTIEEQLQLRDELLPGSVLWTYGMLREVRDNAMDTNLIATRRAIAAVLGRSPLQVLPPGAKVCRRVEARATLETDITHPARAISNGGYLLLTGKSGSGKTTMAEHIASAIAPTFLGISSSSLGLDETIELIENASIEQIPIIVDDADITLQNPHDATRIVRAITRSAVPTIICSNSFAAIPPAVAENARMHIALRGLQGTTLAAAWSLRAPHHRSLDWLSPDLRLTPLQMLHAIDFVDQSNIAPQHALQIVQDPGELLEVTKVQLGIKDIIVSEDNVAEITEVINAIRMRHKVLDGWGLAKTISRGVGVSVLFDGPPGTGKTMAAEVIAKETGIALRRVNVSALVDKYVGETEKNLQRVFEQARGGGYILLFDEADALFGSRGSGKGANDRNANLEINVLLQLMEEHDGITMMTTNLKQNVDPAFFRRILYKVNFALPDESLRLRIWERMVPEAIREPGLDLRKLANAFQFAGGDIKSVVLRASYRAAAAERPLSMADLTLCAQLEREAMGGLVSRNSL